MKEYLAGMPLALLIYPFVLLAPEDIKLYVVLLQGLFLAIQIGCLISVLRDFL